MARTYHLKLWIVSIFLFGGLIANAFSTDLVYINTTEGSERLLNSTHNRQYFSLASYVDTQERLTFCGISSMSATLNSLPTVVRPVTPELAPHPYFTEDSIFNEATTKIKSRDDVLKSGLTLEQIGLYLNALNANPKVYYGSDLTVAELRKVIQSSLANRYQRVMVDFDRQACHTTICRLTTEIRIGSKCLNINSH